MSQIFYAFLLLRLLLTSPCFSFGFLVIADVVVADVVVASVVDSVVVASVVVVGFSLFSKSEISSFN